MTYAGITYVHNYDLCDASDPTYMMGIGLSFSIGIPLDGRRGQVVKNLVGRYLCDLFIFLSDSHEITIVCVQKQLMRVFGF